MAVSIARGLTSEALLGLLADGALHSGETLAAALGVSRAAVWKCIERLRGRGITVRSQARRGYRLAQPVELLDAGRIRAGLHPERQRKLRSLDLVFEVDSTNTRVLANPPLPAGRADVCLCELQHAGRGRRGRHWTLPFGSGIAVSLGWCFADPVRDMPTLSLAVGVALVRALARGGAEGIRLKWPNDLVCGERKLGGVLIELRAEAAGPAFIVIGIGLNVALSADARQAIEAGGVRAASLTDVSRAPPSRNAVAAAILDELLALLVVFAREGFAPYRTAWSALDALRGRDVQVLQGEERYTGVACGVDADGALLVETGGKMRRFNSGEVSVRWGGGPA